MFSNSSRSNSYRKIYLSMRQLMYIENELLPRVTFLSKVSRHPGESILLANLTDKNTWSRLWAHWNAGDIFVTPLDKVNSWAPSSTFKTLFYCFLTWSMAFLTELSASINNEGWNIYLKVSWAQVRNTPARDTCKCQSNSSWWDLRDNLNDISSSK